MDEKSVTSARMFMGFGFVTILSGIYLITQADYLIGISGSFVGIGLVLLNYKNSKQQHQE